MRLEFGINFNGDLLIAEIKKAAVASEKAGFSHIWVGENTSFLHPFPIMSACLEYTKKVTVGTGIISPQKNRPLHIQKSISTLKEVYGNRVVAGLAPGDKYGLLADCVVTENIVQVMESALNKLKEDKALPVFIGASGPRLLELAGRKADGVLLNYVYPDYIKWALRYLKKDIYKAVYGPSLLLPDKSLTGELRNAAAIVAGGANPKFLEEMGLSDFALKIRGIIEKKNWKKLGTYEKFLLERFTISGTITDIASRIEEYKKLGIDQVIFSVPFGKDIEGIKKIKKIISHPP